MVFSELGCFSLLLLEQIGGIVLEQIGGIVVAVSGRKSGRNIGRG